MELGPGVENQAALAQLSALTLADLFPDQTIVDEAMAQCCLSGLWLRHNFHDRSHTISQEIASSTGSYWHGIMHRREPDFPNAKYWFRRVGEHPVFEELHAKLQSLIAPASPPEAQSLAAASAWDPYDFIDLCEAAQHNQPELNDFCCAVSEAEWRLLYEYCHRAAIDAR